MAAYNNENQRQKQIASLCLQRFGDKHGTEFCRLGFDLGCFTDMSAGDAPSDPPFKFGLWCIIYLYACSALTQLVQVAHLRLAIRRS